MGAREKLGRGVQEGKRKRRKQGVRRGPGRGVVEVMVMQSRAGWGDRVLFWCYVCLRISSTSLWGRSPDGERAGCRREVRGVPDPCGGGHRALKGCYLSSPGKSIGPMSLICCHIASCPESG